MKTAKFMCGDVVWFINGTDCKTGVIDSVSKKEFQMFHKYTIETEEFLQKNHFNIPETDCFHCKKKAYEILIQRLKFYSELYEDELKEMK